MILILALLQSITSLSERALEIAKWTQHVSRSAVVYVPTGTTASQSARVIASRVEDAIRANLLWLGENPRGGRLNLFFVTSREEMRRFVGAPSGGWSEVREGTAFFVANGVAQPALRHETMHLLSWRLWGTPSGMWMSEGVATAAAGRCNRWTIDQLAGALYRERQLPTISSMRRRFRTGGHEGTAYYLSAASLVLHIDREYGRDKVRELWRSGGMSNVNSVLGVTQLTLESEWRRSLSAQPRIGRWKDIARTIEAEGCE